MICTSILVEVLKGQPILFDSCQQLVLHSRLCCLMIPPILAVHELQVALRFSR